MVDRVCKAEIYCYWSSMWFLFPSKGALTVLSQLFDILSYFVQQQVHYITGIGSRLISPLKLLGYLAMIGT